jgi:hypothetical protein
VPTGSAACMYVATCTRPTVRHVYSDRTRGELQVAKINFFCSEKTKNYTKSNLVAFFSLGNNSKCCFIFFLNKRWEVYVI